MFPLWVEQSCGRKLLSSLHIEKRSSSKREKALEAKIGALEERFKNLMSSGKIMDSPSVGLGPTLFELLFSV